MINYYGPCKITTILNNLKYSIYSYFMYTALLSIDQIHKAFGPLVVSNKVQTETELEGTVFRSTQSQFELLLGICI